MTAQVLKFVGLLDHERQETAAMPKIGKGDSVELRIGSGTEDERSLSLPPSAAAVVEAVIGHLMRGGRVAVLGEDQEVSPNDAAAILGMSRPLVVHRMEVGDLPFHYVGKHRRAKLRDVLVLKERVEEQQAALAALAADTEDLIRHHGL